MQRFGILTKTQIEKIHETSFRILEQIDEVVGPLQSRIAELEAEISALKP